MAQYSFGSGYVFGVRTDVANATPVPMGVMNDVSVAFSGDLKPLYGSGVFAVELARGKMKVDGKAKFAKLNSRLFNDLYFGQTLASGQVLTALAELSNIPAAAPYTVTVANAATFQSDLGMIYQLSGAPLTKVAAAPTVGQYSVSAAGVYTFAAADASAAIAANYTYTATTGSTITLSQQAMGSMPYFQSIFTTQLNGKVLTLNLFRCGSSKLNFATKQDDWTIPEMDFEAVANSAGILGTLALSE